MKALFLALALLHPGPSLHGLRVTNGRLALPGRPAPADDGEPERRPVPRRGDRLVPARPAPRRCGWTRCGRTRSAPTGPSTQIVWSTSARLKPGRHRLVWRPARSTPPRTYILRLTVTGAGGVTRYGYYEPSAHTRVNAPVVRVQGIDAGFTRRSYAPGQLAAGLARERREIARPRRLLVSSPAWGRARSEDERQSDDAAAAVSLEKQAERASPRPLRPRRRLAERPLLPARELARRAHLVRAVHRPPARLRLAVARRRRPLDQHVAGVQLPRRERRRLGRLLVRLERDPLRRPRAPVPRLRRPLPLPRLGPQLHLVAEHDGEAGRVPVRRRPRVVQERGRARARVRPRSSTPATPSTRRSTPTTSSSATATWAGT